MKKIARLATSTTEIKIARCLMVFGPIRLDPQRRQDGNATLNMRFGRVAGFLISLELTNQPTKHQPEEIVFPLSMDDQSIRQES